MLTRGLVLLAAGAVVVAVGVFVGWWSIVDYATHPRTLNSNSGMLVFFSPDGVTAASYPFFEAGMTPGVVLAGIFIVIAALFHLAIFRRRSRES